MSASKAQEALPDSCRADSLARPTGRCHLYDPVSAVRHLVEALLATCDRPTSGRGPGGGPPPAEAALRALCGAARLPAMNWGGLCRRVLRSAPGTRFKPRSHRSPFAVCVIIIK
eukprot:8045927-Pyramimonas_sp.AAC.1